SGEQPTSATRILAGAEGTAAAATVDSPPTTAQRQARPPRNPQRDRQAAPSAPAERRKNVAMRRLVAFLTVVALLGAGAGAAIYATRSTGSGVKLQQVSGSDARQAVQSMRDLINANTP
ncbi:MAG: hypothetical protein WCI34_00985, partial [Actinomycetes bacterium]